MPKDNVIQTDFLAGEISPRMELQDNVEGRKHGVESMINWIPHLQGSAETAPGTKWMGEINETTARIFEFSGAPIADFIIVVGTATVQVWRSIGGEAVLAASFTSPWTGSGDIANMQVMQPPEEMPPLTSGDSSLYMTSVTVAPYQLTVSFAGVWTLALMPLVNTPASWGGSIWPSVIGFFGGRMWLSGVYSDPSSFWGSKSGGFFDFDLGTALDDEAISAKLTRKGAIRWISGGVGLLIGTEDSEHLVSASGGVITPGDIQSTVQSTNGSSAAQSVKVGGEVMYISSDGRKIRSIEYEWSKDAWRSRDLTYASEHITGEGNKIRHIAYAANPDSLILGLTSLGQIVVATYEPYSQTAGFSRRSTRGDIVSVATMKDSGSDETWMLVDRDGGALQLERELADTNIKLDSYVYLNTGSPISGGTVPHLAQKTCQVIVDDALHPVVIPDAAGAFTLEYSGEEVYIGLPIDNRIISLPVEGEAANAGSTRPMKKRLADIWVKVIKSWRPKVNGYRPPNRRVPTPMGEAEEARTETVRVSDTGWGDEVQVTIEQDLPFKTEIAGWFGRIIREKI